MIRKLCVILTASLTMSAVAQAAKIAPTPIPLSVKALDGCWQGSGEAVGKHVMARLFARPILDDAMIAVDLRSNAQDDVRDRYSAHLIFGGTGDGKTQDDVIGFWTDSFGGGYAIAGHGRSTPGGFDVDYAYPESTFTNRWRSSPDRLTWSIYERGTRGPSKTFASYAFKRVQCGQNFNGLEK